MDSVLDAAPAPLRDFLLTPPRARTAANPADIEVNKALTEVHNQMLRDALQQMRVDCERFLADVRLEPKPPGPELDRAQRHCARLAYLLLKGFSSKPVTGTEGGPFRCIASLLYEMLTSRVDVDLKRHCEAVIADSPPVSF